MASVPDVITRKDLGIHVVMDKHAILILELVNTYKNAQWRPQPWIVHLVFVIQLDSVTPAGTPDVIAILGAIWMVHAMATAQLILIVILLSIAILVTVMPRTVLQILIARPIYVILLIIAVFVMMILTALLELPVIQLVHVWHLLQRTNAPQISIVHS